MTVSGPELRRTLSEPPRLRALHSSGLLDSAADPVFDRFTILLRNALRTPVAVFSLVDHNRQFFKSALGLSEPWASARQTPLSHCFCQYAVHTRETLVVPDAREHPWVCSNGAIPDLGVIAYLGAPVVFMGKTIGALAAIDNVPRNWTTVEIETTQQLAILLQRELAHRDVHAEVAQTMQTVEEKNRALLAMQRALAGSERRIRMIADNLPALVCYVDTERRYRFTNATYAKWLQRGSDRINGRHIAEVHGEEAAQTIKPFMDRAFAGERCDFEYTVEADDGLHYLRGSYVPDVGEDGRTHGIYGLTQDATAFKQIEHELWRIAHYDSLTGVANRKHFNEKLQDTLNRNGRNGKGMALLFLDLDRFKAINDQYGHPCGDEVLKEFARRLQTCVRQTDLVARLAGDEFVLILEPVPTPEQAQMVAEKVIAAMQVPFQLPAGPISVQCSIGIALQPPGADGQDAEALQQGADQALYKAKAQGRNCYQLAS